MKKLITILTTSSLSLLLTPATWGESLSNSTPVSRSGSTTVLPQKKLPILKSFSTSATDLIDVAEAEINSDPPKVDELEEGPDRGQFNLGLGDSDKPILFGFGTLQSEPTVLKGFTREPVVLPGSERFDIFPIATYLRGQISENQRIVFEQGGDPNSFTLNLSYDIQPKSEPEFFSVNLVNMQARNPAFEEGEREIKLSNGAEPWVNRIGGGIQYYLPLSKDLEAAFGSNYQVVSVRDGFFSSNIFSEDGRGNRLTVNNNGQDLLWTINLAAIYQKLNDRKNPHSGTRIRFGIDRSIPVGEAQISLTRFNLNLAQFIPIQLIGSKDKPDFLSLNLQSGTMLGDVPPYEGYNLGGSDSVRGYDKGAVSTGKSFFLASAEYRLPLFSFKAIGQDFNVQGNLFFDYANDLGTASEVIGLPAVVRDKPGEGFGYGLGLRLLSSFGFFRFEFGLNDLGESRFYVTAGERF